MKKYVFRLSSPGNKSPGYGAAPHQMGLGGLHAGFSQRDFVARTFQVRAEGVKLLHLGLGKRGFTLLELVLVLLIMAVATALVGPAISSRLLRADARRIAVQLRAAADVMRVRAVQSGQEGVMIVDPQENTYWREGGGGVVEVATESGFLSARSHLVRENGQVEFHFYPDGTNSGGVIRVAQERGATATAYVVVLDPLLGLASIAQDE